MGPVSLVMQLVDGGRNGRFLLESFTHTNTTEIGGGVTIRIYHPHVTDL